MISGADGFLKDFTLYRHGSHIDHMICMIWEKMFPPSLEALYEIWILLAYWL